MGLLQVDRVGDAVVKKLDEHAQYLALGDVVTCRGFWGLRIWESGVSEVTQIYPSPDSLSYLYPCHRHLPHDTPDIHNLS